jgi:hypothetical protein
MYNLTHGAPLQKTHSAPPSLFREIQLLLLENKGYLNLPSTLYVWGISMKSSNLNSKTSQNYPKFSLGEKSTHGLSILQIFKYFSKNKKIEIPRHSKINCLHRSLQCCQQCCFKIPRVAGIWKPHGAPRLIVPQDPLPLKKQGKEFSKNNWKKD